MIAGGNAGAPQSASPGITRTGQIAHKLSAVAVVCAGLLLVSGFLYPEQARLYDEPHAVGVLHQIVYETPFQPMFLVIVLTPIFFAAARNVSWQALTVGGLLALAVVLPFARFTSLDSVLGAEAGLTTGHHNSLFQLAGPGHQMPALVSVVTLLLMAGVTAMFWRIRVGGLIGLMVVITMIFVWPASLDSPPTVDGTVLVEFENSKLLFGYYLVWGAAVFGVIARHPSPSSRNSGPAAMNP